MGRTKSRTIAENHLRVSVALAIGLTASSFHTSANEKTLDIAIRSQSTATALVDLAEEAGVQIIVPQNLGVDTISPGINGKVTLDEALDHLLENTGLRYIFTSKNMVIIKRIESGKAKAHKPSSSSVAISENPNMPIEEIIVLDQKYRRNAMDDPNNIASLGFDELDKFGGHRITDLEDLGLAVPGLSVNGADGGSRRVFLRGTANVAGSAPLVGFSIDEAPISTSPFFNLDLRLFDLERVEIHRGPQGTTQGQGSVSGIIRLITKKPDLDEFSFGADMTVSLTKHGAPGGKIQSTINLPIKNNELAIRISSTFENAGGWIDQPAIQRKDINGQDVKNIRIRGLWQPVDGLEVNVSAIIHDNNAGRSSGEDENGNFTQLFGLNTTPSIEDSYNLYNLTLNYELNRLDFLSTTTVLSADKKQKNGTNRYPVRPPPEPPWYLLQPDQNWVNALSQEIRISDSTDTAVQWIVGVNYSDVFLGRLIEGALYGPLASPQPFPYTLAEKNSKSWALFGNATFSLSDRFEIELGLRYFRDSRYFYDIDAMEKNHLDFNAVSPLLRLSVDLTDSVRAYAGVAKGFRSGGFNDFGFPPYESENLWSYDLGAKIDMFDQKIYAEVSVFYNQYKNFAAIHVPQPPSPPGTVLFNEGDVDAAGIDFSLSWFATDNLKFRFNGNYVTTEFVSINESGDGAYDLGDSTDYIPDYQYIISASYDFEWVRTPAFVRLDYSRRGKATRRNRSFGPHFFSESDVVDIVNFNIDWQWSEQLSFGLFAENILNDRGYLDASAITLAAIRHRPRSVGFRVGVNF